MSTFDASPPLTSGAEPLRLAAPLISPDVALEARAARGFWIALGGYLALRLAAMILAPFTDSTEARYAEIARKMVETGNWLTPQFDYGVPFWGKPPLHTWLSALGMEAMGVHEFAARLPILLVSLGVLTLVHGWTRRIAGPNRALLAVTMLSGMGLFFGAAGFVMTDMPMVLGLMLAMVGFWNATRLDAPTPALWGLAVFVGLALGVMSKGPVALALCFLALAPWLTLTRNWGLARHLPWGWGLALFTLLTLPWHLAAEAATPGFLRYFLWGEHVLRFALPGWTGDLYGTAHDQPKGVIWLFWLLTLLPWTLLLPFAARRALLERRGWSPAQRDWLLYLLCWTAAPLVMFTMAGNILPAYALPSLPAAAILMAALLPERPSRAWRRGFAALTSLGLAAYAALTLLIWLAPTQIGLKSQKELVEAAQAELGEAPIHVLGRRSFSAEFYSRGHAPTVAPEDLPALRRLPEPVALSLPARRSQDPDLQGFRHVGRFGRSDLFISEPERIAE